MGELSEVPTLLEVLEMLASGGLVGVIVSFLAERLGLFQRLNSSAKQVVVFVVSVGLPVAATVALQYVPSHVWEALQPYWHALALGFTAWLGSQVTHYIRKVRILPAE